MLFLSPKAVLDGSKAIRGGIPLVFPQFGLGPLMPKLQHGFARISKWQWLGVHTDNADELRVEFGLTESPSSLSLWPNAFRLVFSVSLLVGGKLRTALDVKNTNTNGQAFTFTTLLHTYFTVDDISKTKVTGLQGLQFKDRTRDYDEFKDTEPFVTFNGEVDRTYLNASDRMLEVPGKIRIATEGFRDAVVWNPGKEKAKAMADLGEEAFRRMVCVEVGTTTDIVLPAGSSWSGSQLVQALE